MFRLAISGAPRAPVIWLKGVPEPDVETALPELFTPVARPDDVFTAV